MNAEEQEYMDYLIHNRMELTNQITRHLDRIDLLEKKLDIAVKALKDFCGTSTSWDEVRCREYLVKQKLKELEKVQ